MTIEITAEIQALIHEQLAAGRYSTATEVIYWALRYLQQAPDLEQDLLASMADEAAGRTIGLDDFEAEFRWKYPPSTSSP